jgi:hypothetical protein
MAVDDVVNVVLRPIAPEVGKVVAHVGDVVAARIVRLARVHRVVRPGVSKGYERGGCQGGAAAAGRRVELASPGAQGWWKTELALEETHK